MGRRLIAGFLSLSALSIYTACRKQNLSSPKACELKVTFRPADPTVPIVPGRDVRYEIRVTGGQPPYFYEVKDGNINPGSRTFPYSPFNELVGPIPQPGTRYPSVEVTDEGGKGRCKGKASAEYPEPSREMAGRQVGSAMPTAARNPAGQTNMPRRGRNLGTLRGAPGGIAPSNGPAAETEHQEDDSSSSDSESSAPSED